MTRYRAGAIGRTGRGDWGPGLDVAFVGLPDVELVAVADDDPEGLKAAAARTGATVSYDDYHEMLAHPDIDAVAVVLRVPTHYQITKDALNAGKHVFTEWPLGKDTSEAKELADLARAVWDRTVHGDKFPHPMVAQTECALARGVARARQFLAGGLGKQGVHHTVN